VSLSQDRVEIDLLPLQHETASVRSEVLRHAWRRAGWPERSMSAVRWRRLERLAAGRSQRRTAIGEGVQATSNEHRLILARNLVVPTQGPCRAEQGPGLERNAIPVMFPGETSLTWAGGRGRIVIQEAFQEDDSLATSSPQEWIDRDRIQPPLLVRPPAPGDCFQPLGLRGRTTPLNDFFRGRRIAREQRPFVPLLCDSQGIIWVVGHRIADRVRVSESTTRRLALSWKTDASPLLSRVDREAT
jgi:tRNA(Ile)-lysidine synthase